MSYEKIVLYIDYQYIVKENDGKRRLSGSEEPRLFYGRINRLKFKLCHEYCETCYELGIFDGPQKCSSCLPEYQYNYLTDQNKDYYEENQINCVPEGHFYDISNDNIILCDESNSKYYINTNNNKRICFDKRESCPLSYPLYNETSKECFEEREPNSNIERYTDLYGIFSCQLNPYIKNKECYNNIVKHLITRNIN